MARFSWPFIEEQLRIVSEYHAVEERIDSNERLIAKLDETIQAIYKKMFVDDIDPENLPVGWTMGRLSDIAHYVKNKVETDSLSLDNYLSTENMLKDRGGVTAASAIPAGRCTQFVKGNVLVSNIRPYFKKIWLATFDGGCSNDVLCFAANRGFEPEFVYSAIVKDDFFDYVMAGSNGVKMPRGDKEWIMNYPVCVPSEELISDYNRKVTTILNYKNNLVEEKARLKCLKELIGTRISQQ